MVSFGASVALAGTMMWVTATGILVVMPAPAEKCHHNYEQNSTKTSYKLQYIPGPVVTDGLAAAAALHKNWERLTLQEKKTT